MPQIILEDEMTETQFIITSLMKDLSEGIQDFFSLFDNKKFESLVLFLLSLKGHIIVTGVGKSGLIAKKISATLNSSGSASLFLSPQDALHGDLGIIRSGDAVLLLSKSGETDELVELCPALRNKGAKLIAVVSSDNDSRLTKAADFAFQLPQLKEICPFDLAPTTSTISQLIFGDLLSITLMRKKGITQNDFILNHPAGRIGKRNLIRVEDLMLKESALPKCYPHMKLTDILVELSNKKCGCICVVNKDDTLLGIFTDGDLRRAIQVFQEKAFVCSIESLMTLNPKVTYPDVLAYHAMCLMEEDPKKAITVLPVVSKNGNTLLGLIKMHDILQTGL